MTSKINFKITYIYMKFENLLFTTRSVNTLLQLHNIFLLNTEIVYRNVL